MTLAEDTFLLSGEFHYFRVPREDWRDRLRQMADAGLRAASIYVPWNWHAPAPDVTDFTGKDVPERDLAGALSDIAAAGLGCVFRPGPFITAEWRDGGIPRWLLAGDVLALDAHGQPSGTGRAYPVLTYAHPEFRARTRDWLEQAITFARDNSNSLVNIQLDDEPSYWRTLLEPLAADYNPYLISPDGNEPSRFARWLLARHGSLADLNHAYRSAYARPQDVAPPRTPAADHGTALRHLDWLEFKLAQTSEYVGFLSEVTTGAAPGISQSLLHPYLLPWSAVRCHDYIKANDLPVQLTNECYLALFTGNAVTEAKLGAVLACHETYRMWGRGTGAPVTIEVQGANASYLSAGSMELLYALTIARGIRGLNYYMMAGGTNPPGFENMTGAEYDLDAPIAKDGGTRPHYQTIAKVSRLMGGWLGERLRDAEPVRDITIGAYAPYEMAAISGAASMLGAAGLSETFDGGDIGMSAAQSLTALLALNSVSFGYADLESATNDELAATSQLWVPGGAFMAEAVQHKLADYVTRGGHLIILPGVPTLGEMLEPCPVLADLISDGPMTRTDGEVFVIYGSAGETLTATGSLTTAEPPPDARVLARDAATGRCCAFTRPSGAGRVTFLGFGLRYQPTAGEGQHQFLLRLAPRSAWTDRRPLAAFHLKGHNAGLLCVANPLEAAGSVVAHCDAGDIPVTLSGRGAVLLPVNVTLTDQVTLTYATRELLDVTVTAEAVTLTFDMRGERGGVVRVTDGRSDQEIEIPDGGIVTVGGRPR